MWYLSQVKGAAEDDLVEADIISCVEFNRDGELLATGDRGGRVVIFQQEPASKSAEYKVYCTFQSHEPEFDYLKSLEIEEKINRLQWLHRSNPAHFLLSTNDKTVKLWKLTERSKRPEGLNLRDESGAERDPTSITTLRVPTFVPADTMVEASPRRVYANAHAYHINSVSINSDEETFLSADDLRVNLWHLAVSNQSFNIVDTKPANMEDLTEVITAAQFHPTECGLFVYSSSKGLLRLCDLRSQALCDRNAKVFEEEEDASSHSFFSEIVSSISDVRFSHSGMYMMTRDYMTTKVWDIRVESHAVETYSVHDYLHSKLCTLYENDSIFDKFECVWSNNDRMLLTGSYNNHFRLFDRDTQRDVTFEASRDACKPKQPLKPRRVGHGNKRKKDEVSVDVLDFSHKVLHSAWHPTDSVFALAATNSLCIFHSKD